MNGKILALSGGIGGAKLALGLSHLVEADDLTIIANPGDDFEHVGLTICPDFDTLLYTLAELDNPKTGWGRRDETFTFMRVLAQLGGPDWFTLGDGDLALHVERTRRLHAGEPLSVIMSEIATRLGVRPRLLPATDDPVRTRLNTDVGWLDFQDWFVGRCCVPAVNELVFTGVETARPHPAFLAALRDPALRAVIICPSNPFISVDPILAIPGVRAALRATAAPVIAVSPIIGGQAVKGPTAKMMAELGFEVSAPAVAAHYGDLLGIFILDAVDAALAAQIPIKTVIAPTLMRTLDDKIALARIVLAAA